MRLLESKNSGASQLHGVKFPVKFPSVRIKNAVDVLAINLENIVIIFKEVNARVTPWG